MASAFEPLHSTAPLILYIDYKSPYAYLAKDPTYSLEDELGIEVDWRPFTLDIPSYLGSARLDKQGRLVESQRTDRQWSVVRYSYRDVRRYASLRGLVTRGTTKIWDSSLAAIGMLWAKRQGRTLLRQYSALVYERFWKRELDIEHPDVVEAVLRETGVDTNGFEAYASGEGRALHDEIQRAAFDAGIFGVPTYIVDGKIFFGREHLPRIRWILSGRNGNAPDVAYEHRSTVGAPKTKAAGPLSITIDFKSPAAYLAVRPAIALAGEIGASIDWLPFIVSPAKNHASSTPGDDRGMRHRRVRASYIERDAIRYASARGLVINGVQRQPDSRLAAIGLQWTKRTAPSNVNAYVQDVFERYWRDELDIQDENAVCSLMAGIGVPSAGFAEYARTEGNAELEGRQAELVSAGVFDVPTYMLNGEIYVGRQHLPLIRSLLSGSAD